MPKIETNGINLYYEITGQGEPLLLISGLGYGLWQWHKMIPLLAEHFQVIAFDNRGAGQTDKPDGPYSAPMLAADTIGLLEGLGLQQAVVVGHSMGGYIAQELALTRPDLIRKLMLASTNFGGPNHIPLTAEAWAVLSDKTSDPLTLVKNGAAVSMAPGFDKAHPEIVDEIFAYKMTMPVTPASYQAQMAIGLGLIDPAKCYEHRITEIQIPTIIFTGDQDRVVPPGNADLLARQIPNSKVYVLPNAGHLFPIEAPERAAQAFVELLK